MPEDQKSSSFASVDADIPSADLFFRDQPAANMLTPEQIRVSLQIVDFAGAVLHSANHVRPERSIRDLATLALLRRAVVTTEGIRVLVLRGLMEPATSCHRTLLDIEIAFKLILRDESDRMAHRLAASCAMQYKGHGEGILSDRDARTTSAERIQSIIAVSAAYKKLVASKQFDDVRAQVQRDQYWHGFKNTRDSFADLNQSRDYVVSYDAFSWFVHGVNIAHDLSASTPTGPTIRLLVEREPKITSNVLGLAAHKLLEIVGLYLSDRGIDIDKLHNGRARVRYDDGTEQTLGSIAFLQLMLLVHFDVRENAPFRPSDPAPPDAV